MIIEIRVYRKASAKFENQTSMMHVADEASMFWNILLCNPYCSLMFPDCYIDSSSKNYQQIINEASKEHRCFRGWHIANFTDF